MKSESSVSRTPFLKALAGMLALCLMVPGIALGNDVVAEIENTSNALVFYPVIEYDRLVLTVTGPCNYEYREVFDRGTPYFKLNEQTIDGMYRYSLTVMPSVAPEIIDVLKHARQVGDNKEVDQLCREGKMPGAPAIQSDGFLVSRGKIVFDPGAQEDRFGDLGDADYADGSADWYAKENYGSSSNQLGGIPTKDFVINDDLIVDGSACIGFDCVNGESFSFDTIRLKENNLRIKFDDTSVAASFPRTDWQLTANASANGGASKFSIDDISGSRTPFTVEANARSHSLYVDDGGRIGNRTSTPSTEIHTIDGDTPTLRLQQDGSSGFAPQTWDVAGNETNFFIRDVSNGSTLPFRIRPGAPTSSIFIETNGDVGFGTASPDAALDITSGDAQLLLDIGANNANVIELKSSTDGENLWTVFETGGGGAQFSLYDSAEGERFRISTTGNPNWMSGDLGLGCNGATADLTVNSSNNASATACGGGTESTMNAGDTQFVVTSSRSYKENLETIEIDGLLDKIDDIDVYHYDFIDGPKNRVGLMAEDFHQIFGRGSDKLLSGQEIQMALWLAVKELSSQNRQLIDRLTEVESQLQAE
ncbi:MAG: tail fiber domain-containing protein [Acidobacteriota bacterium]